MRVLIEWFNIDLPEGRDKLAARNKIIMKGRQGYLIPLYWPEAHRGMGIPA